MSKSLRLSARPKNWTHTIKHSTLNPKLKRPWRVLGTVIVFVLVWLLASYLFYRRFPDNFRQPNFYAEDGKVFAHSIITNGFWQALFTTFNGYYIWGLYLLEKFGFFVNDLFFSSQFADLPRSFAIVSYGFLGFIATLPILLFKKYMHPLALALLALLVVYVPLRGSDYAIIGTIGNLKFAFLYLAFMLLCYRHYLPANSKKVFVVDFALLICAYTDITVYLLILFALVRYWPAFNIRKPYQTLKKLLFTDRSFQSLVGLGLLLLPQLYIVARDGVPTIPGYLTAAFDFKRLIEIFISRSYVYDILFPINKHLNNIIVLVVFIVMLGVIIRFAKRFRLFFIFGILAIFAGTFLFVVKRTGISAYFTGYKSGGPDQFFYPQNWIFSLIIILAISELVSRLRNRVGATAIYLVLLTVAIIYIAPNASIYNLNSFMSTTVGNIYSIGQRDCNTRSLYFNVAIYPTQGWYYPHASRTQLCTKDVINYQPQVISLNLQPHNNDYRMVANTSIDQAFTSPANNLNGVAVYLSTFGKPVTTSYTFVLYDASCRQKIITTNLHTRAITDNTFFTILFPPIKSSMNKSYCFSLISDHIPASPLAVQLSAPGAYLYGRTTLNGKLSDQAVVFALHYK